MYRLYKQLPKELHSVEYKIHRGVDWLHILWFIGPNTTVDVHITNTDSRQRGVVGTHGNSNRYYHLEDIETALNDHIKLANHD